MATYTDNYNLIKPTYAETADIVPLNNNFEKIDEVMHASQTSLAPAYNQTASYQPGNVVMYELNMYKCTGATSGTWDPSKWTRTTAAETGGGGSVDLDIYGEASGTAEASFSDGAEASLVECEIGIVPTQDLHGYSKPWAGGAGKNKYPDTQDINLGGTNPRTVTNAISVPIGAGTYCISWKSTGEATPNLQMRIDGVNTSLNSGSSFTVTSSANQCYWFITTADYDANKTAHIYDIQIESGTTPSSYEPYSNICPISGHTDVTVTVASTSGGSGEDTTVSLGRTVYGGTLDITTGELKITHGITTLNGTETFISINSGMCYGTMISEAKRMDGTEGQSDALSNYFENHINAPDIRSGAVDHCFNVASQYLSGYTVFRDSTWTSLTDVTTWFSNNNTQVYYELATPQTFTLTPTQVLTLLGQNYVSHDGGGTISLVYIKGDAPIKPNPADADIPLTGIEIDGEKFYINVIPKTTELWSNNSGFGVGTYPLNDDISNYDFIEIYYGVYSEYNDITDSKIVSVDAFNYLHNLNKKMILTGYENRVVYCDMYNSTLSITTANSNTILRVVGIKF